MTTRLISPKVRLDLTEELIEDSKRRDSSHCMLAEAVKAAFPRALYVSVDLQTIRFTDPEKGLRYTYLTPRAAQMALIDFDQGETPAPFTCLLRRGQVTRSGRQTRKLDRPLTDAEVRQRREAGARGVSARKARLKSQELIGTKAELRGGGDGSGGGGTGVPERVGGKTPPTTPFARRRQFGLRALER